MLPPIYHVQFKYHLLHEQFLMPTEKQWMSPLLGSLLCPYLTIHIQFTWVSTTESNSDWPILLNKYLLINTFNKSPRMLNSMFIANPIVFVQIRTSFHHSGLSLSNSCSKSPGSHNFYLYHTIFIDSFQFKWRDIYFFFILLFQVSGTLNLKSGRALEHHLVCWVLNLAAH